LDRGIIAHLDFHLLVPDEKRTFDSDAEQARNETEFLAIWSELANRYKNWPPNLYFELANEPHAPITPELWNDYAKKALEIIRSRGGNNVVRQVIVAVNELQDPWNQVKAIRRLELPSTEEDPNILVTFHYYQPNTFAWQGETFTPSIDGPSRRWLGNMWDNSWRQKAMIRRDFDLVSNWAKKNRRKIILGEFGVTQNADIVSQANYTSFIREEAEKRGMVWMLWQLFADRSLGALYDESTGSFRKEILDALMPEQESGLVEAADRVPIRSDPDSIDSAITALKDPEWTVRERAACALRSTEPNAKAAVPALIAALGDEEWTVRQEAARALSVMGPAAEAAVPALKKVLGDEEWWVRKAAAQALAALGPLARPATGKLQELLSDEEWMVRKAAILALTWVAPEDTAVQEAIQKRLDDEEPQVAAAAAQFVMMLGDEWN
ncbi:MAG: cellulase family glycosylhydrolase, partial [Spirochaetaceae bacterium]|nr:cellulase family glycosylhydrolase [Spirochaetaceae bacterium]